MLSHILGSNPQVCGYSELHNSYPKKSSLIEMNVDLYQDLASDFENKYMFDKLLHNSRLLSDEVIDHTGAKLVILLREPVSTVKSIISMGNLLGNENYKNQSLAFEYYCNRVKLLSEYAKESNDTLFIDSDEIVSRSEEVLAELTDWLGLDQALSQNYSIFSRTGVVKAGDPSKNIRAGKIVETSKHENIELDETLVLKATEAYKKKKKKYSHN